MSTGNPGYSPLPQSNSDSDGSEEDELDVSQGNKFSSKPINVQVSKSAKPFTELKKNVLNYKPLDDESNVEETLTKFQSSLDEVFVQKSDTSERFSTCRKISFVFSLFLCVFTTVAFIWILPCNIESCPVVEDMKSLVASNAKSDNYTWKKILPNLEVIGPCSLVSDSFNRNQNLVFLARSFLNSDLNSTENVLFSLKGEDGSINWRVGIDEVPTVLDCRLIDIDLDGLNDCLLLGKNYITTVNSITGKEIWNSNNMKNGDELTFLNFPVVLPDIDNDEVKDLLFSYSVTKNSQKFIAIVSGKAGKKIGKPYEIKFCETFHNLMPSNNTILFFTCCNFAKESILKVNLMDIFRTIGTISKKKINFNSWKKLKQHEEYSNTVFVGSLRLILENEGHCPESCSVLVNIKDEHKISANKSIYSLINKNTFGMTPVKFKSKHTSGFILKFWKWNEETEKLYFQNNMIYPKRNFSKFKINTKQTLRKYKSLSDIPDLDQEMLWDNAQSVKRNKRRADNSGGQKYETYLRLITETIVKVTHFNESYLNVKNIYKDEIIQICQKPHVCHPDVYEQMHSTLVAHFNGSGREKLVSFSSENIVSSKIKDFSLIQSKIQMLNCE